MSLAFLLVSSVVTIGAVVPYVRDILLGRTKPNIASWTTWTLLFVVATFAEVGAGEYRTAFFTGSISVETALVSVLGGRFGYAKYTPFDASCQVGALSGFLVWWLAATAPEWVGPVISVEGVPFVADLFFPGAIVETARSQGERMREMMAGLSPRQFAAQNRMQLAAMITDPREVERIAAPGGRSDPASVGEAILEMMTTDLREAVAAVSAPSLLVVGSGTHGAAAARAAAERQVARVPQVRVVALEKARHFVMLDAPGAFFTAVEDFLAEAAPLR